MKKIPLGSGKYTVVDDADYDWLNQYIWCLTGNGYVINAIAYSALCDTPCSPVSSMHRLILGLEIGDKREGDHINHKTSDNRRCNLRICNRSENQHNRSLTKRNTSSKFKGVSWNKNAKKWYTKIKVDGHTKWLGSFSEEKYAAQAYNIAAKKYFGEFAFLNKIA